MSRISVNLDEIAKKEAKRKRTVIQQMVVLNEAAIHEQNLQDLYLRELREVGQLISSASKEAPALFDTTVATTAPVITPVVETVNYSYKSSNYGRVLEGVNQIKDPAERALARKTTEALGEEFFNQNDVQTAKNMAAQAQAQAQTNQNNSARPPETSPEYQPESEPAPSAPSEDLVADSTEPSATERSTSPAPALTPAPTSKKPKNEEEELVDFIFSLDFVDIYSQMSYFLQAKARPMVQAMVSVRTTEDAQTVKNTIREYVGVLQFTLKLDIKSVSGVSMSKNRYAMPAEIEKISKSKLKTVESLLGIAAKT